MEYEFDVSDFKAYLKERSHYYRVDGLTFWQKKIPIPIDLFNRIFEDSGAILFEYINHLTVSVLVFSEKQEFETIFGVSADKLPSDKLLTQNEKLVKWLSNVLSRNNAYKHFMLNVAEILKLDEVKIDPVILASALCHEGKKYSRLSYPEAIKALIAEFPAIEFLPIAKTDMFGNVIADRYEIYRSGFSDALANIFNALIDFKLVCGKHESVIQRMNLSVEEPKSDKYKFEKAQDGSLWEPGYDINSLVKINPEHPFLKSIPDQDSEFIIDILYYLSEFEGQQFNESSKKTIENMRQEISRSLWIKYD
jgi:hypothetical protein